MCVCVCVCVGGDFYSPIVDLIFDFLEWWWWCVCERERGRERERERDTSSSHLMAKGTLPHSTPITNLVVAMLRGWGCIVTDMMLTAIASTVYVCRMLSRSLK